MIAPTLVLGVAIPKAALAQSVWGGAGSTTTTNDYNLGTNWSNPPAGAPPVAGGQSAQFANTGSSTVTVTAVPIAPDSWTFNANSQSYTVTGTAVIFGTTTGLVNNANAGQAISIADNLGGAGAQLQQLGASTLTLSGSNPYSGATTVAAGVLRSGSANSFSSNSDFTVGTTGTSATLDLNGFNGTVGSLAGNSSGIVTNNGAANIRLATGANSNSSSTTFAGTIEDGSTHTIGLTKLGSGILTLSGTNTYSGTTMFLAGTLQAGSTGGLSSNSAFTVGGANGTPVTLDLNGFNSTIGSLAGGRVGIVTNNGAANATLTAGGDNSSTVFIGVIKDGTSKTGLTKTGTGTLTLGGPGGGTSTYSGATTVSAGVLRAGSTVALSNASAFTVGTTGTFATLDLRGFNSTIGSLAGNASGIVINNGAADVTLTEGTSAVTTTFAGVIQDGATKTTALTVAAGNLILSGTNFYTGATTINGGTLDVEGSLNALSGVTVNATGTLAGAGTIGAVTVNNNGTLAPGNGTPASSMTVSSLSLASGAFYMVQLNPTTSSFAAVAGTATLGGATVDAFYAASSYVAKQYTILTAGSVSGTFGSLVNTNLPFNFHTTLSYDANDAYLNLILTFVPPPGSGLSGSQQNVANAIVGFFNSTGGIPLVFGGLTPAGLTQISGETATGSQQTTFDAMNQFMGVLTDPFIGGRGDAISSSSGATPFAEETDAANAYAAKDPARSKRERDAYAAVYRKAPVMAAPFVPSWSVWAAGYGGSQTTNGSTVIGSNATSSRLGAVAVGADYRFSPDTIAGFALAGGGTNFSVNGFGTGHSDLFQAGAFVRHTVGPAYFTAALAYGWQDITTDRTVTIAGIDQLRARFNANTFSGRIEDGYRFATPWMGITPYAAAQFTTFDLPAYAEQAIVGANTFALTYGAKSVTDVRSEIGIRTDKSWAMTDSILTLRGRFAWAHDYDTDRSIGATFQTLPGASFVVNGAAQLPDKALTTASAEVKWRNGVSLAATFEGEFSGNSSSYAGKGVARYQW